MIYLESEQANLFRDLLRAVDGMPRSDREEFMFIRSFQGDHLQGNGFEREVLFEDVIALDDAGLIKVTNRHRKGSGFNFLIPTSARARFKEYEDQKGPPDGREPPTSEASEDEEPGDGPNLRDVMVVHGRDEEARRAMFGFLGRLGLNPLDWDDLVEATDDAAPYIGAVLTKAFSKAKAVVVLFSPDDEARLREVFLNDGDEAYEKELTPQARPNVLFEAGMALGVHPTRTVLVESGRLRPFSDIYGRHAVRLSGGQRALESIARRLETAGCAVQRGDGWDDPDQFPSPSAMQPSESAPAARAAPGAPEREAASLNEDAQRWIVDRDRQLKIDFKQKTNDMSSRNLLYSGAHLSGLAGLRRQALQEYRDELSQKRRRYAELVAAADGELPRFSLTDEGRGIVASWREPAKVAGMNDVAEIDDPTSESREPDLRRFEQEGDPPGDD